MARLGLKDCVAVSGRSHMDAKGNLLSVFKNCYAYAVRETKFIVLALHSHWTGFEMKR